MKHHIAMVLTRRCTRIESVTLEGKIARPEPCYEITWHRSPPEFSVIFIPITFSLDYHSICNAYRPFFLFAGKNLYNNEHVAIKMVSKDGVFYVIII